MSRTETTAVERESVADRLRLLSNESVLKWEDCKANHRFMAYQKKQLVIYKLLFDTPSIQDTLVCQSLSLSFDKGLTSTWLNSRGSLISLSSTPVEVASSIFIWHTFISEVDYASYKGVYNARFSLMYRCPHHPKHRHEGYNYIQELTSFEAEFGKQ